METKIMPEIPKSGDKATKTKSKVSVKIIVGVIVIVALAAVGTLLYFFGAQLITRISPELAKQLNTEEVATTETFTEKFDNQNYLLQKDTGVFWGNGKLTLFKTNFGVYGGDDDETPSTPPTAVIAFNPGYNFKIPGMNFEKVVVDEYVDPFLTDPYIPDGMVVDEEWLKEGMIIENVLFEDFLDVDVLTMKGLTNTLPENWFSDLSTLETNFNNIKGNSIKGDVLKENAYLGYLFFSPTEPTSAFGEALSSNLLNEFGGNAGAANSMQIEGINVPVMPTQTFGQQTISQADYLQSTKQENHVNNFLGEDALAADTLETLNTNATMETVEISNSVNNSNTATISNTTWQASNSCKALAENSGRAIGGTDALAQHTASSGNSSSTQKNISKANLELTFTHTDYRGPVSVCLSNNGGQNWIKIADPIEEEEFQRIVTLPEATFSTTGNQLVWFAMLVENESTDYPAELAVWKNKNLLPGVDIYQPGPTGPDQAPPHQIDFGQYIYVEPIDIMPFLTFDEEFINPDWIKEAVLDDFTLGKVINFDNIPLGYLKNVFKDPVKDFSAIKAASINTKMHGEGGLMKDGMVLANLFLQEQIVNDLKSGVITQASKENQLLANFLSLADINKQAKAAESAPPEIEEITVSYTYGSGSASNDNNDNNNDNGSSSNASNGDSPNYNEPIVTPEDQEYSLAEGTIIYRGHNRVIIELIGAEEGDVVKFGPGASGELNNSAEIYKNPDGSMHAVLTGLLGGYPDDYTSENCEGGKCTYSYQVFSADGQAKSELIEFKTLNRKQTILYYYNSIFGEKFDLEAGYPDSEYATVRGGGPAYFYSSNLTLPGIKFTMLNDPTNQEFNKRIVVTANMNGTKEAMLILYRAVHDRIYPDNLAKWADEAGLTYWTEQVERQDENRINLNGAKLALSLSDEFQAQEIAEAENEQIAKAEIAYQIVLKRGGDSEGVNHLANTYSSSKEMREELINSFEYNDRIKAIEAELGKGEAVQELYETILARPADVEGVKNKVESGKSVMEIKDELLGSEEFQSQK